MSSRNFSSFLKKSKEKQLQMEKPDKAATKIQAFIRMVLAKIRVKQLKDQINSIQEAIQQTTT